MKSRQDRTYGLRRSAPLAVSMLALFVALGGWGYAATGGSFVLGKLNSADKSTRLRSSATGGPALVVRNTGGRPAASFVVGSQITPFKVNSSTRVADLNADLLDGVDSDGFYAKGTKVADSELVDGIDGAALQRRITSLQTNAAGQITSLEAGGSAAIPIVGRLGTSSCPPGAIFAVGGCGDNPAGAIGVLGTSAAGRGVFGRGSIGVIGDSATRGVVGTLASTSCAGVYAVGGCSGVVVADGVYGRGLGGGAGVRAANAGGGNIFVAEAPVGAVRARIDATGKGFFNGGTQTGGADFAESMPATGAAKLEPGDVLTIDPQRSNAVRKSSRSYSTLVAGVYSTKPAVLAVGRNGTGEARKGEVPVAFVGIVPTKVTAAGGAIRAGDLLTTSKLPGHAMKASPVVVRGVAIYPTGAILGKALEPLAKGTGVIRVMLMWR